MTKSIKHVGEDLVSSRGRIQDPTLQFAK